MATGRSNQLIKQIGEYLVACELARRSLLVATFSGNVPDFDLIATDSDGISCPIQVKAIKGGSWQFSIDKYTDIIFEGDIQRVGDKKLLSIPDLICVFVLTSEEYGEDQFYIFEWEQLQEILILNYRKYLDSHGGKRPRNPRSVHSSIHTKDLQDFKDNWSLIINRFPSLLK